MISEAFAPTARRLAEDAGLPDLSIVTIPHPVGSPDPSDVLAKADVALDQVVSELATSAASTSLPLCDHPVDTVEVPVEPWSFFESALALGWSDGLPVLPPVPERVDELVAAAGLDPQAVVMIVPPRMGLATVKTVAANAALAGCLPEHMPVVLEAVRCVADRRYGLSHRQVTTHAGAPLIVVNGPIGLRLGLNGGTGLFGPGNRANASIGRALRLILRNVGGAIPGITDMAQHAHPGKYTYCIRENEEANPWHSFGVDRGFAPDEDVVTVMNVEAPHSITDNIGTTARAILTTCSSSLATLGGNNLYSQGEPVLVLGPEHARSIADDGWTKADVQQFLYECARQPWRLVRGRGKSLGPHFPPWVHEDDDMVPIVNRPEDLLIIVAGGAGGKSMALPTAGAQSLSVSRKIGSPGR